MSQELNNCFPSMFIYKHVMAQDHDRYNLKQHFHECADFIDMAIRSKGRVYVHCYRGVSRSTSAVITYLMKIKGMDFKAAKNLCRVKRPCVNPNSGFIRQLIEWQYDLIKENRETSRKRFDDISSQLANPCNPNASQSPTKVDF